MVNASENLVMISPVFLIAKNFIGNLYICSKYPIIKGISILIDKKISIVCLTKLTSIDVIDTTKKTASVVPNIPICLYGRTSSKIILLNNELTIPNIVTNKDDNNA